MGGKHNILLSVSLALLGMFAVSCNLEEIEVSEPAKETFDLRVTARPKGFDTIDVGTKSNKTDAEKTVTSMTMFILDNGGNVIERQYIPSSNPLFSIDREDFSGKDVSSARIWVLANYPDNTASRNASDLDDILDLDYALTDIGMPEDGFPMIGSNDEGAIDLRPSSEGGTMAAGNIIDVTLNCLYAKVVFDISVDPKQITDHKQKFTMDGCSVHNVPSQVEMGNPGTGETTHKADILKDGSDPTRNKVFAIPQSNWSTNTARESGSSISFTFYVPEHQVLPETSADNYTYPWGTGEAKYNEDGDSAPWVVDYRQHYKPALLGSKAGYATYVELHGTFNDHNNIDHIITYKIYLGEDNYGDFFVGRDKQLNNTIRIIGATNSNSVDPNTVSYDHRVDISATQFQFSLERETLLDSHWEIRPIRIAVNRDEYPNAKVKVQVLDPETNDWIRFEMPDNPSGSDYCSVSGSSDLAYGKRKYFTTDLVTNTLADNTMYEIDPSTAGGLTLSDGSTEYCIWTYIDENTDLTGIPSGGGCTSRNAIVRCEFWEDGDESNTSSANYVMQEYNFSQRSLYRINYGGRTYYIEDYEEYLYDFDAKDHYDVTTDGMAWGLDGVQLSHEINAIAVDGVLSDDAATSRVRSVFPNAFYDFYNTKEEASGGRLNYFPYEGRRFTRKISQKIGLSPLATNTNPASAIEYCLNKNKRYPEGSVPEVTNWYLPAIDEIEDICMGGYSDFEVFQNKYYWSSQPAFKVDSLSYTLIRSTNYGNFFEDNHNYARATKVSSIGETYHTIRSGAVGSEKLYSFYYFSNNYDTNNTGKTTHYQEGYHSRTEQVNRIRCVYKQSGSYTSNYGFETTDSNVIWTSSFSRNTKTNTNTDTIKSGSASGSLRVSSGWSAETGTATLSSFPYYFAPGQLTFYVRYSGDKPTSSTWTVSVSSDNSTWNQVYSYTTLSTTFSPVSVDLSSYGYKYVQIMNSTTVPAALSGNTTNLFIDDIQLEYTD